MLYVGLMSGTSANGIDGGLVDVDDDRFELLATHSESYTPGVKESIESTVRRYPDVAEAAIRELNEALAVDFARAASELIGKTPAGASVVAIGSHGQTVYHGPGDNPPVSIQVGTPQTIANLTGLTTVGDFRTNDLRAGGQGAPLAPAFHNAMFRDITSDRVIVNIGGIANLTYLPADRERPVSGYDTGPGNTLMDLWCGIHTGESYDAGGHWAARGRANERFVQALLADPYFDAPAPKSTGREHFHLDWLKRMYPGWESEDPVNIQAGLLEVTVQSIVRSAARSARDAAYEIYVCGGGARNKALMKRLGELAARPVGTTDALGLAPEWVEVCAFAWLAHRRIHGRPGNLPSVTGATREVLLGEVYHPL
jgi:anhydro-N-acetylmuramic acid kinase